MDFYPQKMLKFAKKFLKNFSSFVNVFSRNSCYKTLNYLKVLSPTLFEIMVTFKCNYSCEMCPMPINIIRGKITFSDWKKAMNDPIFSDIKILCVSGGEPFLHPNLLKLMNLFLGSMPKLKTIHINTNGFFTEKIVLLIKKLMPVLQKRGIKLSFFISLDGIGETHNYIRRNPQAFHKTTATISALKILQRKYNFIFAANCVISRKNLYEVKKIAEWCKIKEVPFRFTLIGFCDTDLIKNIDKKKEWDFGKEDEEYLFKILEDFSSDHYWGDSLSCYSYGMLRLYKEKIPRAVPCPFTLDGFRIDSLGNVYYCYRQNKIGNFLNGHSISEIYYRPKNLIRRHETAKNSCRHCNSSYWLEVLPKNYRWSNIFKQIILKLLFR